MAPYSGRSFVSSWQDHTLVTLINYKQEVMGPSKRNPAQMLQTRSAILSRS